MYSKIEPSLDDSFDAVSDAAQAKKAETNQPEGKSQESEIGHQASYFPLIKLNTHSSANTANPLDSH